MPREIRLRGATSVWAALGLTAVLAFSPLAVRAQCNMGSGAGGHDHGKQATPAREAATSDARRTILDLMAAKDTRPIVLQEVLADEDFMDLVIASIAENPRLREAAAMQLGLAATDTTGSHSSGKRQQPPARKHADIYTCPMHLQIRADHPGTCPKCGMTLQRVDNSKDSHGSGAEAGRN